jgi:hypothetical protein
MFKSWRMVMFSPLGTSGWYFAYRVVEPQPAFVYQLQDDSPGEGLGVAAYAEVVVWRDRGVALYVSSSKGLAPCSLARNIDVDERPGNPQVGHLLFDLRL